MTLRKPGISNLLDILAVYTGRSAEDLADEYAAAGYGRFKAAVAEAVIEGLTPMRSAYEALGDAEAEEIMETGAETARAAAAETMRQIRRLIGLSA